MRDARRDRLRRSSDDSTDGHQDDCSNIKICYTSTATLLNASRLRTKVRPSSFESEVITHSQKSIGHAHSWSRRWCISGRLPARICKSIAALVSRGSLLLPHQQISEHGANSETPPPASAEDLALNRH